MALQTAFRTARPARRVSAARRLPLLLILSALSVLPGCDRPRIYSHPQLQAGSDGAVLVLQAVMLGEEPSCRVLAVEGADRSAWEEAGQYLGRLAGLMPAVGAPAGAAPPERIRGEIGRTLLVFMDGTVARHAGGELEILRTGRNDLGLLAVARLAGEAYAVGDLAAEAPGTRGEGLQLYRLGSEGWQRVGIPLPTVGAPAQVRLAEWRGAPTVAWRIRLGEPAEVEPGIRMARWTAGAWRTLPDPPDDPGGSGFALAGTGEALWLLREVPRTEGGFALRLDRFPTGSGPPAWLPVPGGVPLAPEIAARQGLGLALAPDGAGFLAARVDFESVHILHATDRSSLSWSVVARPLSQSGGRAWAAVTLLLSVLIGVLLILSGRSLVLSRGSGSSAGDRPPAGYAPGALALPFDRTLAMAIDGCLVLPLPLVYLLAVSDLDPGIAAQREGQVLYWVWLGGLALYGTLAEARGGATLGKRLLRIRVRKLTGGAVEPRQALIRNLLRAVDFFPIGIAGVPVPYLVALVAVTLTRRRQRVGDLLAGTVVRRHVPLRKREIVLASASPRRRDLLDSLGLAFAVRAPAVAEILPPGRRPQDAVQELALRKGKAVAETLDGAELVLAADTVIALDGEILGKPSDRSEALGMLRRLSGRSHKVHTGVAILDRATGQLIAAADQTEVVFRDLSEEELLAYVDAGESDGKAGAYGIQGPARRFVSGVYGSTTNVIGLPLELLRDMLEQVDG